MDAGVEHALTAEELAAGEALFARPWQFLKSVPALEFLPEADRPEIAFAGRSNVGKSTLINALVGQRGLARASNTPGRTQELNYFETAGVSAYVVDMPGYGFARAPKAAVERWTEAGQGLPAGPIRTTPGLSAHRCAAWSEAAGSPGDEADG